MILLNDDQMSPVASTFSKQLGAVAELMMISKHYQYFRIATLRAWIAPAIRTGQIKIYYAPDGTPVGYVTWAWLSDEAEARLINDPKVLLYPSEWTDGEALWILGFMALPGIERMLMSHIRATLFTDQNTVKAVRLGRDGVMRKVATWSKYGNRWRQKANLVSLKARF